MRGSGAPVLGLLLTSVALLGHGGGVAAGAIRYNVVDIGLPSGYDTYTSPLGLTESGQALILGMGPTGGGTFLYENGWLSGRLTDVNVIAPNGLTAGGTSQAVNSGGAVIGSDTFAQTSFVQAPGQARQVITTPDSPSPPVLLGLNDRGTVVGYTANYLPFVYQNATTTLIPKLAGTGSAATAVNNNGLVVGGSWNGDSHAFMWDPINGIRDLGLLKPDDIGSLARDVNSRGQIVGWSNNLSNPIDSERAFLFQDGRMYDLNSLVDPHSSFLLTSGQSINDAGVILADAVDAQGRHRAVLLTPQIVPEPASLTLFLTVGAGLLARRRWRRRRLPT